MESRAEVERLRTQQTFWANEAARRGTDLAMARARVEQLEQALREARQFIPYEKGEQGPLPNWIVAVRERVDAALDSDQRETT